MHTASAAQRWASARAGLHERLVDGYATLDAAAANLTETFADRRKKIRGPLADILRRCQDSAELNVRLARAQRRFCEQSLRSADAAVDDATAAFRRDAVATGRDATDVDAMVLVTVTPRLVQVSATTLDALCLCWLLAALLGHREANAFVEGAKSELIGALGDPGAGVFTLLKRAHAVATRSLRQDQDAAELLQSLADFKILMAKWREVAGLMGRDVPFAQALEVFAPGESSAA